MKRVMLVIVMGLMALCVKAEIGDAFKGVWPVTDPLMTRSLNGEWQLKVVKGIDDKREVPAADATWGKIAVPGCWEAYGFCEPKYDYPDSLTGYYRTEFTMPEEWRGQQVYIRLDGVLRGYDLWLNDQLVGTWESAYNTCLFDLTPYLKKKGPQQLAMRVYTRFKGYEFDCFDDWATNGIFRDVTLMAVPKTHLSDLTVTTKTNGEVTVKTEVANATKQTTVDYDITDAQDNIVSTGERISQPKLWTAETPYLYTLHLRVKQKGKTLQTFTQKIGIKELTIGGNVLKLNGQAIKLRGVNAHSTDPRTVKVISDDLTLKDMRMMKEASVNYMRLSHYPREPRFYELADSLGFYLVNEVPFGYGDKHLSSRSYQDILMTRAEATVRRDKNHASVIIWSLGNENPLTKICIQLGDYVKRHLDASHPICYPQVGSYFRRFNYDFPAVADLYASHYPTTGQIGGFYQRADRPVIFTEYCHTLGTSFEDHDRQWEIIERTPCIAGGSVWEWADQGMPFCFTNNPSSITPQTSSLNHPSSSQKYGYEERVFTVSPSGANENAACGFEMNGNKGTDGLVYADRTPLPNYYELQRNYARAFVAEVCTDSIATIGKAVRLTIANRFDFLNLKDNVTFHWALTADRDTVARGAFSPDCLPHDSVQYTLPLETPADRLSLLCFDIIDAQGHHFLQQSFVLQKPDIRWEGNGNLAEMIQCGPLVRAGRKPTLAEQVTQKGRLPQKYLLPLSNDSVKADVRRQPIAGGEEISFTLTPDTANVFRAELGMAFLLAESIDRVQWIGQGPYTSYPGRHQACRYGLWAKHKDDLYFEGNHGGVDAALLTDANGRGVLIAGDSLDINFEQTDRGIVVTVNAAVAGLGPKFAKTAFPTQQGGKPVAPGEPVSARFRIFPLKAGDMPQEVRRMFNAPSHVPQPLHPFASQYDTYLMRFNDVTM
ncbi:MAG: hypothetical protein IKN75_04400 [Prevotella sp.]|nr:hypothetical protein [Prevotella sp.]